jgi:hypothetical protein
VAQVVKGLPSKHEALSLKKKKQHEVQGSTKEPLRLSLISKLHSKHKDDGFCFLCRASALPEKTDECDSVIKIRVLSKLLFTVKKKNYTKEDDQYILLISQIVLSMLFS